MTSPLLVVLAMAAACGPSTDDGDGGDDVAGSGPGSTTNAQGSTSEGATTAPGTTAADSGSGTGTGTGEPIDCNLIHPEECFDYEECHRIRGAEASPTGEAGVFSCSDIALNIACVPPGCEAIPGTSIICTLDEPNLARWIVDECVPPGWEICPDATCV
jgi:hypothetical protein